MEKTSYKPRDTNYLCWLKDKIALNFIIWTILQAQDGPRFLSNLNVAGLTLVPYAIKKELISWPLSHKVEGKLELFCTVMGLGGETQANVLTNASTN